VLDTIARAEADDVVLLAGKGHEDYQVIGTEHIDYNERAIVADWLRGDNL
jgi:UDP-N-acetylmuramoyl-L-alanyl-D-glutamate--2,6-diaminopimelate ligase